LRLVGGGNAKDAIKKAADLWAVQG
jgi:hypothetical protein